MVELFRPFKNTKKNQIVKKNFGHNPLYQKELQRSSNAEPQVLLLII
jgi:hypothetical protein